MAVWLSNIDSICVLFMLINLHLVVLGGGQIQRNTTLFFGEVHCVFEMYST